MSVPRVRIWFTLTLLWLCLTSAHAQPENLSAVVTVIADQTGIRQANTLATLPLRRSSIAPLGAGDRVSTGENGRATVAFADRYVLYLLPNTIYHLTRFTRDAGGILTIEGTLEAGVAIQQRTTPETAVNYHLITTALTVTDPSDLFIVWAVSGQIEAVISGQGDLTVQDADQTDEVTLMPGYGLFATFGDEPIALDAPYHAAQLLAKTIDCPGTVSIRGALGLRLRRGAALDYPVAGLIDDGAQVQVVGTTQNGLWYRVPAQSGFGWLYSALVIADCSELQVFPNLLAEIYEEITGVTEAELVWLEPFYGRPLLNPTFYR